jgi:hypothetical protein
MPASSLTSHIPEIALAAALAWGSGLRLYAVLFAVGLAGTLGWLGLPEHLAVLQNPLVLGASGFMTLVEFGADKLPWLDSLWDAVHTFIRIPAGAGLAAAVFGSSDASISVAAAILGGTIAAGTHLAKAGGRAAINTSPEPFSNWVTSFTEDSMVPAGLWLAVAHPIGFLFALALFAILALVMLGAIVTGLAAVFRTFRARLAGPG